MKTIFVQQSPSSKAILPSVFSIAALSFVLAGCSPGNQQTPPPPATNYTGKVVIRGSHTVGEELAPKLIAEYKKEHPTAAFDIESIATGYGLAQLRAGLCDLAGASREPIKEEQELARASSIELDDHIIGAYSVAVVVNGGNPVSNLTKDQVRDIFTGTIKNWKDVGGNDAAIQLYIRDPISGTYLGFQELAMEKKPYAGSKTFTNYAGIVQAVAADPNGIGYSGIDLAKVSGAKAVSIGGIAATAETVNKGQYPYTRTLRFYTNKTRESKPALDFVQFVQSEKGQAVVSQLGLVPHR